MGTVSGNIVITKGSEDYITLQLLQDDGVTPVDISGAISVALRLRNTAEDTVKKYITTGGSPKLFITDASNGKIQLRQVAADFNVVETYEYYAEMIDSVGVHPIPEKKRYVWEVIDSIPDPT